MLWAATYVVHRRGANHTEPFKLPRFHHDPVSPPEVCCQRSAKDQVNGQRPRPDRAAADRVILAMSSG